MIDKNALHLQGIKEKYFSDAEDTLSWKSELENFIIE